MDRLNGWPLATVLFVILTVGGTAPARANPSPLPELPELPELIVRPRVLAALVGRCGPDQPLFINDAIEIDVNNDGLVDIVYNATSCLAAKASGPDLHGILLLQRGKVYVSAAIPDLDANLRATLVGNTNFAFGVEANKLVQNFTDTSERNHPLKLFLVVKNNTVAVVGAQRAPVYSTSYDCKQLGKGSSASADFAVCSVKRLAAMDKLVGEIASKNPGSGIKKTLKNFREARLTTCHLVRGWVACFEKIYLNELEALGLPKLLSLESKCGKGGMYFAAHVPPAERENLRFVLRYVHSGATINDTPFEDQVAPADQVNPALVKAKISDSTFARWSGSTLLKNLQLLSIARYALESSASELPAGPALLNSPAVKSYLRAKAEVLGQLQARFGLFAIETGSDCN